MAVDISVSCCCWVAADSEIGTLSLVHVTLVAGPLEEMQVRVLDSKSYVIADMIVGWPVYGMVMSH